MTSRISEADLEYLRVLFGCLLTDVKDQLDIFMKSSECTYTIDDLKMRFEGATSSGNNGHLSVVLNDETLQKAKSIKEMFEFLSKKCSLYDYQLLRLFVGVSKCKNAKKLMTVFNEKVNESLLQKLNLLNEYDNFKTRNLPFDKNRKLTVKCENKDLHITIEDEKLIRRKLCDLFNLPHFSVLLVDITEGCIALIYEISLEVKKHLLQCNITSQAIKVHKFVFTKLIIDDEMELQMSPDKVFMYLI